MLDINYRICTVPIESMPRKGYKSVTVKEDIYMRLNSLAKEWGLKSTTKVLENIIPTRCLRGKIVNGHVFIDLEIGKIIVENVLSLEITKDFKLPLSLVNKLLKDYPILHILFLIGTFSWAWDKIKTATLSKHVNEIQPFLIDTGATCTALDIYLLPSDIREDIKWAMRHIPVRTATTIIRVAKGTAFIRIPDSEWVEVDVHFIEGGGHHHILGINSIKKLFGSRFAIDFEEGIIYSW